MTLSEFLLARIAEDEEIAQDSYYVGQRWSCEEEAIVLLDRDLEPILLLDRKRDAYHAANWSPERVLAECEAKRRIVAAFEDERQRRDIYNRGYDDELLTTSNELRSRLASNAHCRGLEVAMLALALPCADHPDYDTTWIP